MQLPSSSPLSLARRESLFFRLSCCFSLFFRLSSSMPSFILFRTSMYINEFNISNLKFFRWFSYWIYRWDKCTFRCFLVDCIIGTWVDSCEGWSGKCHKDKCRSVWKRPTLEKYTRKRASILTQVGFRSYQIRQSVFARPVNIALATSDGVYFLNRFSEPLPCPSQ